MKRNRKILIRSKLLSRVPGLVYGFTNKSWGDMRQSTNRDVLLHWLGLSQHAIVWPQQVHGTAVHRVTPDDMGKTVKRVDALVLGSLKADNMSEVRPILAVHVADCVPILLVDPVTRVAGAAHAGWRGTLAGIAQAVVAKMVDLGASAEHIIAFIGPHIGPCCYTVPEQRAQQFRNRFGNDASVVRYRGSRITVDLGKANYDDLLLAGIRQDHIERSALCTSCNNDTLYSYRGQTSGMFGEIMGFIGFTS